MKRTFIAIAALAISTSAQAQAPPWQGFYAGIHGGQASADWNGNLTYNDGINGPDTTLFPGTEQMSAKSFFGGLTGGYNWQAGITVFGIEGDISGLKLDDTKTFAFDYLSNGDTDYTWKVKTELNYLATLRGRLGLALGNVMLYGTGGLAYGHVTAEETVTGFAPQGFPAEGQVTAKATSSDHLFGFVYGAGAEWMLDRNWTIKAEYLRMDFGKAGNAFRGTAYPDKASCGSGPISSNCSFPHVTDSFPADVTVDTIKFGLNYKF